MINLLEAAAGSVIPALVYGYGGYLVIQHRVSLGYVIACLQYLGRSLGSVTSLGNIPMMFRPVFAHAERLERTLAIPPESTGTIPLGMQRIQEISLEDVSIGYDGPNSTLVSGINLLICAGETISLVGPSGSGKTSIAMVLCGLYRPQCGVITVNRQPLTCLKLRDYRRHISVVSNDDFVFQGTLLDNLLIAKPDATPEEIAECLQNACLDEVADELPQGLNTVIGQGDVFLSAGQRVRISLARAMLRSPSLLILDEATANLDQGLEERLHRIIKKVFAESIVLVISHRSSTIAWGKRVYRIHEGCLTREEVYLPLAGGQSC